MGKEQVWYQTNLGYSATKNKLYNSEKIVVVGDFKGRFTFILKDYKDVTFQITSKKHRLSITYPDEVGYESFLELVKPFLVMADNTPITKLTLVSMSDKLEGDFLSHPLISMTVTQNIIGSSAKRQLPSVGFNLSNQNNFPVKVVIEAKIVLGGRSLGLVYDSKGYYSGKRPFLLNAGGMLINGSFSVPQECVISNEELTIELRTVVFDQLGKEHQRLPESWTYMRNENDWFFEPSEFTS